MRRRPRLLFLCQTLPFPPDRGVAIRSFHILRLLAGAYDVTALCFYRREAGPVSSEDLAYRVTALCRLARVEAFAVPQEHDAWRRAWDHLRSVAARRVYTAFAYESGPVAARVAQLRRAGPFDLVHVDSITLSHYLPLLDGATVVCAHHNVESILWQRRAQADHNLLRRSYLRHQAQLMERELQRWCGRCALNVVVSEVDRSALQRLVPEAMVAVVPNGVDIESFRPVRGRDEGIIFVGETNWVPNRDAMRYFCEAILPQVRAALGHVRVRWVGRAADEERRFYDRRYGIELTGYVPDVRPYVQDAACYIAPLRIGGGTRLKILDAWAMGKAVVSTSIGCEGLRAADDRNILIRDDPERFADAVCTVLRDGATRARIGGEARRTAERHYSWERIGAAMLDLYGSLPTLPSEPPVEPAAGVQTAASARQAPVEPHDALP